MTHSTDRDVEPCTCRRAQADALAVLQACVQHAQWQDPSIAAGVYEDLRFVLLADEATSEQDGLAEQAAACIHVSLGHADMLQR